jgi:peptidoglycan/xylan/chitin deacetylase (PgdA/CDA1 family)
MSRTMKSGLVRLLRGAGLADRVRTWFGGAGVILLLHEIQADPARELGTGIAPAHLGMLVAALRSDGWDIVSLDEALHRLANGTDSRPYAVLTFDDGYRDHLTHALPILERLAAPFTLYVPTGAVTRAPFAWWLGLRALFRAHEFVAIEAMDRRFACVDFAAKVAALREAGRWIHDDYRRQSALAATFAAYGISLEALAESYFLSGDELRRLAGHALVTIGAHTVSHRALAGLPAQDARREIADSRAFLENLLDHCVDAFAYPYGKAGSWGPRETAMARAAGFGSAVTSEATPVFPAHRCDLYALPRIAIRPDETAASLYYRASGLSAALMTRSLRRTMRADTVQEMPNLGASR